MSELVAFDGFSLLPQGPTLSFSLDRGQAFVIVGPASSGKSRFLRCATGKERPGQGRAVLMGDWIDAADEGFPRRATPQTIARKAAGRRAGDASHALTVAGLWDVRDQPVDSISETQRAACAVLPVLASQAPIMVFDSELDRLDAWTLDSLWSGIRDRLKQGACALIATNRLDLCRQADTVCVMRSNRVAFAGTLDELIREGEETTLTVETRNQQGIRALVEPFETAILESNDGLVMRAKEGQAIAAKLLMEGYGDVRTVVVKQPTVEDAVRRIVGRG